MKLSFTLACFMGAIQAADLKKLEPVWGLKSVNDHRTDSTIQAAYGDHSTKNANARPPYQSALVQDQQDSESDSDDGEPEPVDQGEQQQVQTHQQIESPQPEKFKPASADGQHGYERVVPEQFSGDSDDIFMRSMIKNYAKEGENEDGSPNGTFWMSESTAEAAAKEVLGTHKGLKGDELEKYLDTYWGKTWGHFDVNKSGHIEVIQMPQFMRFLASDQSMSLQ